MNCLTCHNEKGPLAMRHSKATGKYSCPKCGYVAPGHSDESRSPSSPPPTRSSGRVLAYSRPGCGS